MVRAKILVRGFSLVETLIAMGLLGGISIGVMKMMNLGVLESKKIEEKAESRNALYLFERELFTDEGCAIVRGKKVGEPLDLKLIKPLAVRGIQSAVITDFVTSEPAAVSGLAKITVDVQRSQGQRSVLNDVYLPVYFEGTGSAVKIENCNSSFLTAMRIMSAKLCEGTYGSATKGMDCPQTLLYVQEQVAREICRDLYGGQPRMSQEQCQLNLIHAGKNCPGSRKLKGFKNDGSLDCV